MKPNIDAIFACLQGLNPTPQTELIHHSPFQLLIAVILSAQATDISVNKGTQPLFAHAPDALSMQALGVEGIIPHIRHIGLYKNKAKHVHATCNRLITDHQGQVPNDRRALEALPGVGRKTANVILNTAFGHPTLAVDTHLFRLAHRLGLSQGQSPEAVESDLLAKIPAQYQMHAHHWLILHGRYLCTARRPQCHRCPIADWCPKLGL